MKKRLFPNTMEPTTADFNGVGEVAEEGIADLVKALASQNAEDGVIFSIEDPPTASANPPPWTITLPEQHFAINGVVGKLAATTFQIAAGARTVALFLRLVRTNYSENRNYLDLSGSSPVSSVASFTVEKRWTASYVVVDPYTGPGDDPVATGDDVGDPIKLAEFVVTGAPAITVTEDPDNRWWVIPAGTPSSHGSSHLTGGGDPIPVATTLLPGLLSAADKQVVDAAITAITVNGSVDYLVATTSGTPKQTVLNIRTAPSSFKKTTISGNPHLALNFSSGPLAGTSETPARNDHKHPMSDSPVQVVQATITVSAAILGTSVAINLPSSVGTVVAAECFWVAPGISGALYPLIETSWSTVFIGNAAKKIGCKARLNSNRDLRIEVAPDGLCELTTADYAAALSAAGSQTWDSIGASGGSIPTTGKIVVRVIAARTGLSL